MGKTKSQSSPFEDPAVKAEMAQGSAMADLGEAGAGIPEVIFFGTDQERETEPTAGEPETPPDETQYETKSDFLNFQEQQTLKCVLTPSEIREIGNLMARAVSERNEAEATLKSLAAQYKAKIANADSVISECAVKINSGWEMRPVNVEVVHNYATGNVIKTRLDTLDTVESRPMNAQERQRPLNFGG